MHPLYFHLFSSFSSLLLTTRSSHAQFTTAPSPASDNLYSDYSSGFAFNTNVIFFILILIFLISFVLSLYLNRYSRNSSAAAAAAEAAAAGAGGDGRRERRSGLDTSVLETFPIVEYAKVKGLKAGKAPLECAVCLAEFADRDTLRVLPGCCHVFHPDCIDVWLDCHVTCPVCRSNLNDPTLLASNHFLMVMGDLAESRNRNSTVSAEAEGFRRSKSAVEGADRFTLRLPELVRRDIEAAGVLRRATSAGDYSHEETVARRSGRWWSLLRSLSVRRRREAETGGGSSRRPFFFVRSHGEEGQTWRNHR